jgi:hypothetical protein
MNVGMAAAFVAINALVGRFIEDEPMEKLGQMKHTLLAMNHTSAFVYQACRYLSCLTYMMAPILLIHHCELRTYEYVVLSVLKAGKPF